MGIGASIFLIVLGLILALAVNADFNAVDIQLIGWIITGAGVIGLLLTLLVWGPRQRATIEEHVIRDEGPPNTY